MIVIRRAPIDVALAHHGAIRAVRRAVPARRVHVVARLGPDRVIVVEMRDAHALVTGAIDAHVAGIGAVIDALIVRVKDRLATSVGLEVAVEQQRWRRHAREVRRDVAVDVVVVMRKSQTARSCACRQKSQKWVALHRARFGLAI